MKTIAVAALSIHLGLFSALGAAAPFSKKLAHLQAKLRDRSDNAASCTNFSGNWVGKCMTTAPGDMETMQISQYECSEIEIDGLNYSFASTKVTVDSAKSITNNNDVATDWDVNKLGFTQMVGLNARFFSAEAVSGYRGNGKALYSINAAGELQISSEGLITVKKTEGADEDVELKDNCVYKKQ